MKIRSVDLVRQYDIYKTEILNAIYKVLDEGDFILGNDVKKIEESFSKYIGSKYGIGVDSGSSALILALSCANIGPGDEVITVPNTYISTAFSISECGANIVFVDVEKDTQLMDVSKIPDLITEKTKAIIPVHLFGQMVDMKPLMDIAKKNKILIIEDSCQAHGASQNGEKAGSIGDLSCFSFYPGKNLGAYGDAGMILTKNKKFYDKLLLLRNYGSDKKYFHSYKGKNARLDTIHAAVLQIKLKHLDSWNKKRQLIADLYSKKLKNIGDLILPTILTGNKSSNHLYVVRTKQRDELFNFLNSKGVETIIHYPIPIHLQKAYQELALKKGSFPISESLSKQILSLPIHPHITNQEVEHVVNSIKNYFKAS